MASCGSCGRHVSESFRRVFADAGGRVHGCPVCGTSPVPVDG